MKRALLLSALALLATAAHAQSSAASAFLRQAIATPGGEAVSGRYKVRVRPSVAAQFEARSGRLAVGSQGVGSLVSSNLGNSLADAGFQYRRRIGVGGWIELTGPTSGDPRALCAKLRKMPGVSYAEPVFQVHLLLTDPNDPDFNADETDPTYVLDLTGDNGDLSFRRLWHLDDTGAMDGWTQWPGTWYTAATKPRDCPTVAVVDTGIDAAHPDFANAGSTSIDSAFGGQIRVADSRNVIGGQDPANINDHNGHGTHVAGLALAAGNNGGFDSHGVIGTGYGCRGMIFRVFDDSGNGDDSDAASAIVQAADAGAEVINLSLGTTSYSQVFQDACTYAFQKGSLVVAAGNESGKGGGNLGPIYPAACSGVLAVTADSPGGTPADASYAGYGQYVDIAAPGGDVIQTPDYVIIQYVFSTAPRYPNDISNNPNVYPPFTLNYSYLAGTSMASPIVAGAAGSYFGRFGLRQGSYNNVRVLRALERSAYGVQGAPYGTWELTQGYGALDMGTLLSDGMTRSATRGSVEGIVYLGGTPVPNASVKATNVSTNAVTGTTTLADGTYRFGSLLPGIYDVKSSAFGFTKTRRVQVFIGSDRPATDFWINGFVDDTTPPVAARLAVASANSSGVTFDHWGYDTETGIDKITAQIGTTSGGSNVLAPVELFGETSRESLAATLPAGTYYLTLSYTNGNSMTTQRTASFIVGNAATVSGALTFSSWLGATNPTVTVEVLAPGTATVLETHTVAPAAGGAYSVSTGLVGTYDVRFSTAFHFLRKKVRNVIFGGSGASVSATLFNGDATGDNQVLGDDYALVRSHYGAVAGSASYDARADLDGDGAVLGSDYAIVRANYGRIGD